MLNKCKTTCPLCMTLDKVGGAGGGACSAVGIYSALYGTYKIHGTNGTKGNTNSRRIGRNDEIPSFKCTYLELTVLIYSYVGWLEILNVYNQQT